MNETEKDRILRMVAEGIIKPNEAAQLLAALAEDTPAPAKEPEKEKKEEKPKAPTMEVQMQRADGSTYTIEVPTHLVPMFLKLAGTAIKESARLAAQEAWSGLKNVVRTKTTEVRDTIKTRVAGGGHSEPKATPTVSQEQEQVSEARKRILQMVQNGRISAEDASKLIQQLDALQAYNKTHPTTATAAGK